MKDEPLTPAQRQRVKELFDEAFEMAPMARAIWLAEACPDDEVRAEVEKLLQWQAAEPEFLEEGRGFAEPQSDAIRRSNR